MKLRTAPCAKSSDHAPGHRENVAALRARYPSRGRRSDQSATQPAAEVILAALDQFMECVRYLNTRRSETTLLLESEAAVQDAVFLMLRPWVPDLVPESPTDRIASRFTIKDFRSANARTIVEAKYVRDRDHGRSISRELHDDIETYRSDLLCDNLVFFIYDPDVHIPDRSALKRQIEVDRVYDGRRLTCALIVKP